MLFLDDASQCSHQQHKARKSFRERMQLCTSITHNNTKLNSKTEHEINRVTQISKRKKIPSFARHQQKRVRFGLMVDLCCTLVRFDLSNAYKNCATHAYICFSHQKPNGKISLQLPLLLPLVAAAVSPCYMYWTWTTSLVLCEQIQKLPSKSFNSTWAQQRHHIDLQLWWHTHAHTWSVVTIPFHSNEHILVW